MNALRRVLRGALAGLLILALGACGGGLYVDVTDSWGPAPTISVSSSTDLAQRGEVVRLTAAISAPNGIDRITFYRIDPGVSTSLGVLFGPPAQIDTTIPLNAGRSVGYWARVCDGAGLCTESRTVTVNVYP